MAWKPLRQIQKRVADTLRLRRDVDALYRVLYDRVHDLEHADELASSTTAAAFGRQWTDLPEGEYLLSDPWFRENVDRILTEQELLLPRPWFAGKRVLDAGCGNGRWSYGFSKLGADLTCADINDSALEATSSAIGAFDNPQSFMRTSLECLDEVVPPGRFDLVFCWGVLHHCVEFNRALDNLARAVRPGGVLYLYLYGRKSLTVSDDLRVFRDRVKYNVLMNDEERVQFLLRKAKGDRDRLHNEHDIYAPLINRRFLFEEVAEMLARRGFRDCMKTIDHSEVFVRATRGDVDLSGQSLPPKAPPYWFQGKHL